MTMIETLTVLETAAQTRWFVHSNPSPVARGHVLAVTPEAAYACQETAQAYLKVEDYAQVFKRVSEYSAILLSYLEWETWLDDWTQQSIPEFGVSGFKPAGDTTFLLQLLFAEIWATATSLREFLEVTRPTRIALWPPEIRDVPWFLQPVVSPHATLLPAVACALSLPVVDLSHQAPSLTAISKTVPVPPLKQIRQWLRSQLRQNPLFVQLAARRAAGLPDLLRQFASNAPEVLLSGNSYDTNPLTQALYQSGACVTILPDDLPPTRLLAQPPRLPDDLKTMLEAATPRLLQESRFWEPLEWCGLDHSPLWAKPFQFWWHHIVPELWLHYLRVQRLLARRKFVALVTWDNSGSSLGSAAANAVASARVPRYVYQHGSSSGLDAKVLQMYLRHTDNFLVYGEQSAAELRQSCPPALKPVAQIIPVGSARLDALRQQHQPEKSRRLRAHLQAGDARPIILYIPTVFGGYGRAIGDLAAYPDVSYFELQQTILKLWNETPSVRLLYKALVVANDPNRVMPEFIRKCIPNGTVTRQRLTDLMWSVDAIVVDHTITALSEVLLTNKSLVVYMPKPNAAGPQAKPLLQKRAAVAETPDEFVAHVHALLQAGRYPELESPNDEFLRAYCTHLNDGRSAERSASVILQGARPK